MTETAQLRLTQIVSNKPQRKLLVKPAVAKSLQEFLSKACHNNVLVINTNVALDVYHFESCNCGELITDSFLLNSGKDQGFQLRQFDSEKETLLQFETTLTQLAKHPQTFLAYCKKFAFRLKRERINQQIVWKLFDHFDEIIKKLEATGTMPHIRKIKEITVAFKEVSSLSDHDQTVKTILSDFENNQILN